MFKDLKEALAVLRPSDRPVVVGLIAIATVSTVLEIVGLMAIAPLMSFLSSPKAAETHLSVRLVESWLGLRTPQEVLLALFLILFGVFATKNLYAIGVRALNYRFAHRGSLWLMERLLELYLYGSVEGQRSRSIADAVRTLKELAPEFYFGTVVGFVQMTVECMVIVGIGVLLLWMQPVASLAAGVMMGVALAVQLRLYGQRTRKLASQAVVASRESYRDMLQTLSVHKEIRLRGRERYFIRRLLTRQDDELTARQKQRLIYAVGGQVSELMMLAVIAVVVTVIVLTTRDIFATFSTIAIFAAAAIRLMPTSFRLIAAFGEMKGHAPDVSILRGELDAWAREIPQEIDDETAPGITFEDSIRLAGASYRYPQADRTAVRDIDLTIRRGEFIGIVGPSGSGKSTLTDLLMALVRPADGRLLVDGSDVWKRPHDWRRRIGYVPQAVELLEDSLRRNIAFGDDEAEIDDVRVANAARMAQLDAVVKRLPAGLNTLLGQGGNTLSGGERQRVGIARALYHQPDVLVLDEATSQLDVETEHALSAVFARLKGETTLVLIAHRLSTVQHCDRIVFVKEGRIEACGPFTALTKSHGGFARMVQLAKLGVLAD
jgi:ATP-binding cassette subfamily C protein